MNLLSMPGNLQSPDRIFPGPDAGSQVPGAAESGFGFASLMRQSQGIADQQVGAKVEKNTPGEVLESPSMHRSISIQSDHPEKEKSRVANAVGEQNSERMFSDKPTEGSFLSSPDDSTAVPDNQAEKTVVPDEIMYSYVAVMAMLDGLALEEGTAAPESGVTLLSQSAVEGQGALGSAEPQAGKQLPIEQLVQQVMDNVTPNGGGKTASEIAVLIGSAVHGGGDEQTGISGSSMLVEEPMALGSAEPQAGKQLPIERLIQQVMDSVPPNGGGKTASEIAALISSAVHGGGDEQTGISVSSMTVEEPMVFGSAEPQAGKQLPIEQLVQQVIDNVRPNGGGKTASEIAALIGSAINGKGMKETGANGLPSVAENGGLISGSSSISVDILGDADGSRINLNLQKQQDAATFTSNSRLESPVAKVSAGKNIVAAEQAAVPVTQTSKQQPGNLFSGNEASRSALKTVPGQLLAAAGEKVKSIGDQQPHENPGTPLGETSGQKNTATKIIFSQSQGFLDQQSGGQKSRAGEFLALGLSEFSADENHNLRINMNAAGENQFSGLPLPGLESAVSKGENQLPVTSDDLLNQVTMRLPDRHGSRQVVTIQLQPESLGKVEVKLVMEQQKLTAHFVVQHSEVRDVLLKHVSSLHDALVAKGVEVKQVAVDIAPAEKMTGMAVNVDQHPAGGNQTSGSQQFSPGSEQRQHAFSAQQQGVVSLSTNEEGLTSEVLSSALSLKPGYLHIQA
ncbi:MAG: flagellar hook-length control protein FliK [Pseudomonadota bacterium]|nr:flagellar hook-length control protein FliK [Pseudomonadota bacterium]